MLNKGHKTILTHDGNFHADDIFAVAVISSLLEKRGTSYEVVRSRDEARIKDADYVVDVGGVHDPDTDRFDHHQRGGAGKRENSIPFAAFGLVWKKYGEDLCMSKEVAEKIDEILIQWIDAADNGITVVETKIPNVYPYDIGLFFNAFTPRWDEKSYNYDDGFSKVLPIAKEVLSREISKRQGLVEAREIVEDVYNRSIDKRLIVLDKPYPSSETLAKFPEPLFIVFPRHDQNWSIKTIRNDKNSFIDRKSLPKEWAGKKDGELEKITGVPGAIFCHNGRFLAVAKTKEAVLKMAEIALNS